jgi:hypothetical protein
LPAKFLEIKTVGRPEITQQTRLPMQASCIHGIFERLASSELDSLRRSNLNLLACRWITAGSRRARALAERAETDELYRIPCNNRFHHGTNESIKHFASRRLARTGCGRNCIDEFLFIHATIPIFGGNI